MRRLCFLVPNVESAHGVVGDLRAAGVADANLYVVAREGTPLGDLPDAGKHGTIAHSAHPHEAPSTFPAPETWPVFKKFKETVAPNHEHWTTIQSCEFVLSYDVTPYMKRIIHQPTLTVTSWYDDITMTEFEVPAFHAIPSPRKKLVQVGEGASHMSLYDNPNHLRVVGEACAEFAREHLCG